ncbi:MAG: HesA/MoeB/ThiF family protein [Marinilabiliaceae bacterium]|nr:HesA/MoeB/ThiF family protein [Marinilabiliaceae bacterium]
MNRYSRHLLVEGFNTEHQEKLKNAKVLVVGAGGLGSSVLYYLSAAGIGTIGIIDFDIISESNLNRQILYSPNQLGKSKAEEACLKIKEFAPQCNLKIFNEQLSYDNADSIIGQFDIIADGTDNIATRYIIDRVCEKLQKPYIYASAEQLGGQLSVFHLNGKGSYRSLFPDESELPANPPGIIGAAAGIIGSYEALEIIKIITGIGTNLSGKLMIIDALHHQHQLYHIS